MRVADCLLNILKMKLQIFLKAGLMTPLDSSIYIMAHITGNLHDKFAVRLPVLFFPLTKYSKDKNTIFYYMSS
jgi:hypothetical protein